jgi:hypothetical protein
MRVVSLFVPIVFGLAVLAAPDLPSATSRPAAAMAGVVRADAGDAEYQALQRRAALALDGLRQARERRLTTVQFNVN